VVAQVDRAVLERLLDLQGEDSAIRLLIHRKETLVEARRLAEVNEQLAELDADSAIAEDRNSELGRETARLEDAIASLDAKIGREEARMYSGRVANPKELSSLQAEVAMLRGRRSGLEDELLEVMVSRDQADETLAKLRSERDTAAADAATLAASVAVSTQEIDSELHDRETKRAEIAHGVPSDLLALYDQLRAVHNGVGAAALVAGTCQGCHTQLPAREVERMKAEGGLQRCDNCRRILVVA
jgi:uncharacterized protein